MVDNIFDGFYGYNLFNPDGTKLVEEFANLGRLPMNLFYVLRIQLTEYIMLVCPVKKKKKEHVVLIDNTSVS